MADLIERLLYQGESESLDFKRDQYPFENASDEDKSELLKDILSFANAWRATDAYILIGVDEVKGQHGSVAGINDFLDDAKLQQFVNSKTNDTVRFTYRHAQIQGKTIALIQIPVQERPRYLKKNYGKLAKNVVYVRRGSSTAEADPGEIAQMGAAAAVTSQVPVLVPFLGDPVKRAALPDPYQVKSMVLEAPKARDIPDYRFAPKPKPDPMLSGIFVPTIPHDVYSGASAVPSYYRELAAFTRINRLTNELYFAVENVGDITAQDVRMRVKIGDPKRALTLISERDYPSVPKSSVSRLDHLNYVGGSAPNYDYFVERVGDDLIAEAQAEKVQPKSTHWFFEPVYFGGAASGKYALEITLFADNLPSPIIRTLSLELSAETRKVDLEQIIQLERERMANSKAHQDFLRKLKGE